MKSKIKIIKPENSKNEKYIQLELQFAPDAPELSKEELKKQKKREYMAKWRASHKEKIAKYNAKYKADHKNEITKYNAKYYHTNMEYFAKHNMEYYAANKKQLAAKKAEYRQVNKGRINAYNVEYNKTPKGRAHNLANSYKQKDKEKGFNVLNNISTNYILKHIFTQPCYYCGNPNWEDMGADRIDNLKCHTPDNVLPCCGKCNIVRSDRMSVAEMKAFVEEQKRLFPQDFKFEV